MNAANSSTACSGFQRSAISRRHLLSVGAAGLASLSLPTFLRAAETSTRKAKAKAVIFLHQFGGPSQTDTFDMKPNAPEAIRGELKPIASNVSGIAVCHLLPRMAQVMDKVTLVRSVHHQMKNHNSA